MARRYSISFDTLEFPGRVRAVWVELGHWFMKPKDVAHVDLADHPLYPELERYVLANPSSRRAPPPPPVGHGSNPRDGSDGGE